MAKDKSVSLNFCTDDISWSQRQTLRLTSRKLSESMSCRYCAKVDVSSKSALLGITDRNIKLERKMFCSSYRGTTSAMAEVSALDKSD